jgi:hypothetical protein
VRLTLARLARIALLAAAAITLVACGDKPLDTTMNEAFIRGVVVRQIGVEVTSVRCPDGLKAKQDSRFTCVVTGADGSAGAVRVRQTDDDGNIEVTAPFLHMREVEDTMEGGLGRQLKTSVAVSCQEIVVVSKSALFTCKARYDGKTRTVSARMTDTPGRFRYRLAGAGAGAGAASATR